MAKLTAARGTPVFPSQSIISTVEGNTVVEACTWLYVPGLRTFALALSFAHQCSQHCFAALSPPCCLRRPLTSTHQPIPVFRRPCVYDDHSHSPTPIHPRLKTRLLDGPRRVRLPLLPGPIFSRVGRPHHHGHPPQPNPPAHSVAGVVVVRNLRWCNPLHVPRQG